MKVQLIRPPLDEWYGKGQLEEIVSLPAGLCLIGERLRDMDVEVEVLDGFRIYFDDTLDDIDGDVVGATDVFAYHLNALRILEEAKKKGATTIIGGTNVNHIADRILRNHPYVDYAVIGDGEEVLPLLLSGEKRENIPNLVYRKDGRIVKNPRKHAALTTIFDLEDMKDISYLDPTKPFPIATIRGCLKAEMQDRCSFCSIDQKLRVMDPELAWEQMGLLYSRYLIDYFFESGDTFIVGKYPEKLLEARPDHLSHVSLRVYACPDQVTRENADILRWLNVREIIVGVESLNDTVLRKAGKSYRRHDIEKACEILQKQYFNLHLTFMYGLPGETSESAEETFRFAESLVNAYPRISKMVCSLPVPLPGTELFENLRQDEWVRERYQGDLDKDDFFDYQALVRLQLERFTSVGLEEMQSRIDMTKKLIKDKGSTSSFYINET
jgi:radical SAM superfamily enzyme YgiQ (UPF0313 family)